MQAIARPAAAFAAALLLTISTITFAEHVHEPRAVLVTGASSGIGRNIAETLAANGFYVYAGARKDGDLAELNAIDNVTAVRLDVTKQDEIDAAVALIEAEGRGLYGLVNNAGVAVFGTASQMSDSDLEWLFDINVFGVARVTRAFAPMIIESKGRIVTTGSISGILSSPTLAAYSMSKHAVEAYTDSLAGELAPAGVHVSVVEPGNYKSKIRRTTVARTRKQMEAAGVEVDEQTAQRMQQIADSEVTLKEPDDVSAAVMHAMNSESPQRRYMVVPIVNEAEITIRKAIEELVQLNEWHVYRYDRDELVTMLDDALKAL
ncbi:MAG: SDR family oxidoreductase [Proteobacteria bacterium]|nr:SDR family oxidoreductase [Pseudomonadota bacterium]